MPTQNPTAKQQQCLDFVKHYIDENGYSPSFRQIANHIGITASGVTNLLNGLEGRGLITRNLNEARSIRIMEKK